MLKVIAEKEDGSGLIIFGFSHRNLDALLDNQPIFIEMSELGLTGRLVIASSKAGLPVTEKDTAVFGLTSRTIKALKAGQTIRIGMRTEGFEGEILLFSAKDEHTMEQMFSDFHIERKAGSTCGKCGSGRRDDGSCDCKETMT